MILSIAAHILCFEYFCGLRAIVLEIILYI